MLLMDAGAQKSALSLSLAHDGSALDDGEWENSVVSGKNYGNQMIKGYSLTGQS